MFVAKFALSTENCNFSAGKGSALTHYPLPYSL